MVGVDTDARIALGIGITKKFKNMVKNKQVPLTMNRDKIIKRLSEIESKFMALKWSYLPLEQILLSKNLRTIEILAKEIFDSFPNNWEEVLSSRGLEGKKTAGTLQFFRDFYYQLRDRISKGFSDDLAASIDVLCGEILSIEPIDEGIWKCLVADDKTRYFVVTNIPDLKKGDVVPIAKLPPDVVHGVYSQGMFAGSSKGLSCCDKENIGKRPKLTDKELGQARGILEQEFLKIK
ncbi:MAG: hypothetical protein GF308_04800 [Candidatus Heimdallarchaeota archaeon]|nr:hypothetical protein [Candidatus Heimdallarchaeota archaeon]